MSLKKASRNLLFFERVTGVEPAALGLGSRCSTTELHPQCCLPDSGPGPKQTANIRFYF